MWGPAVMKPCCGWAAIEYPGLTPWPLLVPRPTSRLLVLCPPYFASPPHNHQLDLDISLPYALVLAVNHGCRNYFLISSASRSPPPGHASTRPPLALQLDIANFLVIDLSGMVSAELDIVW